MKQEDYDCRGHCLNMSYVQKNKKPLEQGELMGDVENAYGYFCNLTNRRCVGAKYGWFMNSNDKIVMSIIERCPSRKTIDDALKTEE